MQDIKSQDLNPENKPQITAEEALKILQDKKYNHIYIYLEGLKYLLPEEDKSKDIFFPSMNLN